MINILRKNPFLDVFKEEKSHKQGPLHGGNAYDIYFGLTIRDLETELKNSHEKLKNFFIQALHDDDHDREDRYFLFIQSKLTL